MPKRGKAITLPERQRIVSLLGDEKTVAWIARHTRRSKSAIYAIKAAAQRSQEWDADWASHMETSGHWPDLREIANTIQKQLRAPMRQLIGFPSWDDHNPDLILESEGSEPGVSLEVEKGVLYAALKEHLLEGGVWHLVEKWKEYVRGICDDLDRLTYWVRGRPELRDRPWLPSSSPMAQVSGLTERFAQVAVVNAAEDAYFHRENEVWMRSADQEYEVSADSTSLRWSRGPISYVMARGDGEEDLKALRDHHLNLRQTLREELELVAVVADYRKLEQVREELTRELEVIANRSTFPRTCRLCRD